MADGVSIDMSSFRKFAAQMRAAEVVAVVELNKAMAATAAGAAASAREKAEFSTRIPATVRAVSRGLASYEVVAGGPAAPNAAPLNNRGVPGEFEHPVFGQEVFVSQVAHPFMPTKLEVLAAERVAAKRAVSGTWHTVGFR